MNGVHDMGGMDGFGPVRPEANEPVFHEEWERRVFAINRAMGYTGAWNGDISRHAKELLPADVYLGSSYYRRWALGLESMLMENGLVGEDEFAAGHALQPGQPLKRKLTHDRLATALMRGSYERPAPAPAAFKLSDRVRMRNIHPKGHTRLPRYVRGHVGVVERVHGCHVFPDSHAAAGRQEDPQWLYTVRFDGRALWGEGADPTLTVSVDAFEPYLEKP
jgi:nitrile hydratase subunit beta